MPKIFLFGPTGGQAITLTADAPSTDGSCIARSLDLPGSATFALNPPITFDHRFLEPLGGGGDLKLKVPGDGTALDVTVPYSVNGGGKFRWFGTEFNSAVAISASLTIHIPTATPEAQPKPFVTIAVCGAFALDGAAPGVTVFSTDSFCCQVEITDLPVSPSTAPQPGFSLRLPSLGIQFPRLSLPWKFPDFPQPPFQLPAFAPRLPGFPLDVSCDSLKATIDPQSGIATIDVQHLRIGGKIGMIEADLHIVPDGHGGIDWKNSSINVYRPDFAHTIALPISGWQVSKGCLVLGWSADRLQDLLSLLLPDFVAGAVKVDVVLRFLSGDSGITEIRLDWAATSTPALSLPGFDLAAAGTFSLIADIKDSRLLFACTLDGGKLTASTSFLPFGKSDGTELQRTQCPPQKPFLQLDLTVKPPVDLTVKAPVTVLLADLPAGSGDGPHFFQQLATALTPLVPFKTDCTGLVYNGRKSLQAANFDAQLTVNADDLHLPMLAAADQFLSVTLADPKPTIDLSSNDPLIPINLAVKVHIATLDAETTIGLKFHLESFAFTIDDDSGISFKLKNPLNCPLFGLKLTALGTDGSTSGFEILRLVTKDSNYQLLQSKDCIFQLSYTEATSEGQPILFNVTNFSIGPKGVNLDAEVLPRPARLSGVDTEFTFTQGAFQIRDSQIQDFSIAGSGPLPPALVGSATASIALQFHKPQNGSLKLVSGSAQLDGKNLLKCQGTRFQFSVDALGLKFVDDGGYHLYFTVTGTARFTPFDGDDPSGPLALLKGIELRLMECPLTGDARVISKHVEFLIELPQKVSFSFLSCFEMEVRGIGFVPQAQMFAEPAAAMQIAGQIKFADSGDELEASIDFHNLYVGLPAPGSLVPRLYCRELGVGLSVADAFELSGMVDFLDDQEIQPGLKASGFRGQGSVTIQGLPTLAVSFAFLRVRAPGADTWDRAWFVYVQVPKISIEIPALEIFIREIGFGFGYRYTLAMIGAADQIQDPKELIKKLQGMSLSQGELASFNQWSVDDDTEGRPPRWTIVFRAMIAESSATQSPTEWLEKEEEQIPCLFLMDAVVALRSDLTFLMSARGWLFTNYWDYVHNTNGVCTAPLVSGFVLLSPRQRRFLAHVASNPNGRSGSHPPLPDMFQQALTTCYFTATLLIEPGLFHAEIGWPNQLRWNKKLGPVDLEFNGGAIFRVASTEMVAGFSFQARGTFDFKAGVDLGFIGARLTATAQVSYGARYIGVLGLTDTVNRSAYYSVQGIDIRVHVSIGFWIHIDLLFGSININFNFDFDIAFTLAFQFGLLLKSPYIGLRGTATVGLNIMGHGLNFGITLAANQEAVDIARAITEPYLSVGLEATDVEPIPGEPAPPLGDPAPSPPKATIATKPETVAAGASLEAPAHAAPALLPPPAQSTPPAATAEVLNPGISVPATPVAAFITPDYSIFSVPPQPGAAGGKYYFVLIPSANRHVGEDRLGFLPPPPVTDVSPRPDADFEWTLPAAVPGLMQYDVVSGKVDKGQSATAKLTWKVAWDAVIGTRPVSADQKVTLPITVQQTMRYAYTLEPLPPPNGKPPDFGAVTPIDDPIWLAPSDSNPQIRDGRLNQTSDSAYEAAVRGAAEQVSSPRFRPDPYSPYDVSLSKATSFQSTIYQAKTNDQTKDSVPRAVQLRSATIHQMIRDVSKYSASQSYDVSQSIAFQFGLVFSVPSGSAPDWLLDPSKPAGTIRQRATTASSSPDTTAGKQGSVAVFNAPGDCFNGPRPPRFDNVRQFADENTIAISWDLVWPETNGKNPRTDPEHHLAYYIVRRKPLNGSEPSLQYTVRPVDVLQKVDEKGSGRLTAIRTRFHVFDEFNHESAQAQAQLPMEGRSYLYTITPVDIAGNSSGRPLSLVATRYPQQAPPAPANAELRVTYPLAAAPLTPLTMPKLQPIGDPFAAPGDPPVLRVYFPLPTVPSGTPIIPAKAYRLLFRLEQAMPIGSYGLGSSAQGSQAQGLPVSNACPLRSDIVIPLKQTTNLLKNTDGTPDTRLCYSAGLDVLRSGGVLPKDDTWRPDSWLIFIQAGAQPAEPNIWSPLAQVQPVLEFSRAGSADPVLRRPAALEFISQPVMFAPLPPEDTGATAGFAQVPVPVNGGKLDLASGPVAGVSYVEHPEHPRAIQFVWNQSPSSSDIPPDLNAGFTLYEIDLDAHPKEDLAKGDLLEACLRPIQQVELLPRDRLAITPPDTLEAQKWEAWYTASLTRATLAKAASLKVTYSNWFSWRDSEVVWPPTKNTDKWPKTPQDPQILQDMFAAGKLPRMHPFLQQVVKALSPAADDIAPLPRPLPPRIYVAPIPAGTATDIAGFIQETSASTDPYGWRILQRFGLSICLQIRDPLTGEPLAANGDDGTVSLVKDAIDQCLGQYPGLENHLHLELLFQPGKSIQFEKPKNLDGSWLLDSVQISLRPIANCVYRYRAADIVCPPSAQSAPPPVTLDFGKITDDITIIAQSAQKASDQPPIEVGQWVVPAADHASIQIGVPQSGKLTLLLRSRSFQDPLLKASIGTDVKVQIPVTVKLFDFSDQRASYFTAVVDWLKPADQWSTLRRYLTMVKIALPDDQSLSNFPDLLPWLQRFLDYAPGVPGQTPPTPVDGPWLATAYPRLVSPLATAPDLSGRITSFQLVTDEYAHAFRYYIRSWGRYDALWQSIASSPLYASSKNPVLELTCPPLPDAGGLDVVLDRIHSVARPLILSSRRIDPPAPGKTAHDPASMWELIVTKHPEQNLSERNWAVARQLAWRQLVFTVMRTFAFQTQLRDLRKALPANTLPKILPSESSFDPNSSFLPGPYPAPEEERLDFSKEADIRAVDLPTRTSAFGSGSMVIQYRGLPYFYKHRFTVAAQAGLSVSEPCSSIQQDFEYRSPAPQVSIDATDPPDNPNGTLPRSRRLQIQLANYWECCTPAAQAQWPIEDPAKAAAPFSRYSSLPDLSVIYQLVFKRSGNIADPVAEFSFRSGDSSYTVRQLNTSKDLAINPKTQIQVVPGRAANLANMLLLAEMPTGELTRINQYRQWLANTPDLYAIDKCPGPGAADSVIGAFVERWFPARAVSVKPDLAGNTDLQAALEVRKGDTWILAYDGKASQPDLESWATSVDDALAKVIRTLKPLMPGQPVRPVQIEVDPLLSIGDIPSPLSHSFSVEPTSVTWAGATSTGLLSQFDALLTDLLDRSPAKTALSAVRLLLNTHDSFPAVPTAFAGAKPDRQSLAALLGNPLTSIIVEGADNNWILFSSGVNLGEPAGDLLARLEKVIPDPTDLRRKALAAVFSSVDGFMKTVPIPGVPPLLSNHVMLAPYIIHVESPLPPGIDLSTGHYGLSSQPDKDSMGRLMGDIKQATEFNNNLAPWISEEGISSRNIFPPAAPWQDRQEFPIPEACEVRLDGAISPQEKDQLLAVKADAEFNNALRQLAAGAAEGVANTVRVSVGLEQIAEILPVAGLPTAANPTLTWRGILQPAQARALGRWITVSAFRDTFKALRVAIDAFTYNANFDPLEEYPRSAELASVLAGRLQIERGTLNWSGLLLEADQDAALQDMVSDSSLGKTFHSAVAGLLDTLRHTATVTVKVQEPGWAPRPKQGDWLPDKLLIAATSIRVFGLMTLNQARTLASDQAKPDQAAVARLFAKASALGLNGAGIEVWARLGPAATERKTVDTSIFLKG